MTGHASSGRTRYGARGRTRTIRSKIQKVSSSVTERDQLICLDLYEHRVLTTEQLYELHFSSIQRARARLSQLYELGVIWRNRPRTYLGSLPWHYILDEIGSMIVAEYLGIDQREVGYRADQKRTLIDNQRLGHTRAANSFFTRMIYVARSSGTSLRVAEWRGEAWCARRWQLHVRPDGYARLEGLPGSLELILELDLGTENRGRLEDKMERYRVLARAATAPDVVLFCFPSAAREASARRVLGGTPMPVATATLDRHLNDPLGPNWLLVGGDRRLRLTDLPTRTA
ncbi:MAG TPA: replication-relaxation family protein [Actinomycetota bacterium]